MLETIPARRDPCWSDPATRTSILHGLVRDHALTRDELCDLLGQSPNTVKFFLNGHRTTITADALRALMYDLRERAKKRRGRKS